MLGIKIFSFISRHNEVATRNSTLKIPYPKQQRLEMGSDAKHISVSSFRKKEALKP